MYNRVAPCVCVYDVGAKVTSLNEEASEREKQRNEKPREEGVESSCPLEGGGLVTSTYSFLPVLLVLVKIVCRKSLREFVGENPKGSDWRD